MKSSNRIGCFLAIVGVLSFAAVPGFAAQVDAVWNVGSGNWNAAANWLPAVVPNNGNGGNTYHVKIDNGAGTNAVVALNQIATIDLLSISAGDTLNVNNIQDLRIEIGPIVNDGLISLNGANSNTELLLASSMSLNGSGVLQIGNIAVSRLIGVTGGTPQHLTHASTHTIRGGGTFGADTLTLTNNGLINANLGTMTMDLAVGANVNAGTIQASLGTLNINNTVLDNTNGFIKALDPGTVNINSSTINGGQLEANAGTVISGNASTLSNVTLTGVLRQDNIEDLVYDGTLTNNGTIELNGLNSPTEFRVHDNGVTLTGTGVIVGNNTSNVQNYINDNAAATPPLLVNTATHTIRGGIRVGNNRVLLNNQGLIDAFQPAAAMTLDLAAGANINTGTIQASATGTLNINDTVLDNAAGLIRARDTSIVNITSSTITGGSLEADAGAAFSGHASTLQGITLTGLLRQDNSEDITYEGTITNNGRIELNSTNSPSELVVPAGGVTFAGPGEIVLSNSGDNLNFFNSSAVPPPLFTHSATHTIRGSGQIGRNAITLSNQGLINANQSVPMFLDLAAGSNTNTGIIQASAAGTLNISDTVLDNSAGFIKALDTSTVNITNSTIVGGPLQADATAAFSGNGSTLQNITLTGLLRHDNGEDIAYEGTITNNGRIELNGINSGTEIVVSPGGVTFEGTGEIVFANNANNLNFIDDSEAGPAPLFVNGAAHTLRGSGRLGNDAVHITNNGTILANQFVPMVIDPPGDGQGFVNDGTLTVANAAALTIQAGGFSNSGTVDVAPLSHLTRVGDYTQTAGATNVNGTLTANGVDIHGGTLTVIGTLTANANVNILAGTLTGNGTINGGVGNTGTVAPGDGIGELVLNHGFAQGPSGIISIEIGGLAPVTQHDVLRMGVDTLTQVGGVMKIRFVNGFDPQIGDSFEVMHYSDPSTPGTQYLGDFNSYDVPCNLPGRRVEVIHIQATDFFAGSVTVRIIAADDLVGIDVNCDCAYSVPGDMQALIQSMLDPAAYDALYPGCTGADVNGDGQRNGKDVQAFVTALLN